MQYVGFNHNIIIFPVASNDNEDLLALQFPISALSLIQEIKLLLVKDNLNSGILLSSRKERKFYQEVLDAECYITFRYFRPDTPEIVLRKLKRYILDRYLFPQKSRSRKP